LEAGRRLANEPGARSFCDALLAPMPGEVTYAINARLLAGGLVVGDGDVAQAMAALFTSFKVVAEPGGAVALPACLSGAFDCRGKTVAVVTSGGNVDAGTFRDALEDAVATEES
ncbi:MAG: pyridoxal-5'-phosphate-dependent protein, partial [Alphaproteobacteria bacterium]